MKKKNQRKKQEQALKRRTQRLRALRQGQPASGHESRFYREVRAWPIAGCWIRRDWETTGLAVIMIARRRPDGHIAFANYLVDLYCLGLKDTFCRTNVPPDRFHRGDLERAFPDAPPVSISPELAHEIIYGSIEYAAQFGFQPHRDFTRSQYILDPPDLHPRSGTVKFGKDGKPFFVAGPHDNVAAVMRQLAQIAGEGNFHALAPIGSSSADLLPMDDDDEGENAAWVRKPRSERRGQADKPWWKFWK